MHIYIYIYVSERASPDRRHGSHYVRRPLYSVTMKITTHLDHIGHCKTASGANWSNR